MAPAPGAAAHSGVVGLGGAPTLAPTSTWTTSIRANLQPWLDRGPFLALTEPSPPLPPPPQEAGEATIPAPQASESDSSEPGAEPDMPAIPLSYARLLRTVWDPVELELHVGGEDESVEGGAGE